MPQLLLYRVQEAQLKKPFPSRMGVSTHPSGRNGYEEEHVLSVVPRRLVSVSHTAGVEASASSLAAEMFAVALEAEAFAVGAFEHGVVLRRFAARAFRDGVSRFLARAAIGTFRSRRAQRRPTITI